MRYSKKRKIYIILSAVTVAFIMGVIFYLSAQNGEESSDTSSWLMDWIISVFGKTPDQNLLRTFAHFCEFGVLGFFLSNLFFSITDKLRPIVCILLSWGYAWTDEIHQIFVPERAFQLIDLTVDLGGIILGTAFFSCLSLAINKIKQKQSH